MIKTIKGDKMNECEEFMEKELKLKIEQISCEFDVKWERPQL